MAMKSLIRDTLVVLLLSGLVAVAVNLFRPNPLPWVADQDYETMVPCPEPLGEVDEITVESDIILDDKTLLIDAREKDEFELGSVPKAVSVPFDWLDPVPEEKVAELVKTRAARVVVFGDGLDPDSGRELARELAGRGMRNVSFVKGGAKALFEAGLGTTGGAP